MLQTSYYFNGSLFKTEIDGAGSEFLEIKFIGTGKSVSEALILESVDPQYD